SHIYSKGALQISPLFKWWQLQYIPRSLEAWNTSVSMSFREW
ncbi:unnamed protein product, partial [Gulo gulo]